MASLNDLIEGQPWLWPSCNNGCFIDIAALSETRLLDEGSLTEEGMGYTFYGKGYPQGGQHLHGVGLAIKNRLLPKLNETPVGII